MRLPLIGTVEVAGKLFTVSELKLGSELKLILLLREMYERQKGSAYKRLQPMLDEMTPADRAEAIANLTRAKVNNDLPGAEAEQLARMTPEGVALELWMRARKHHPGLTQEEVRAIITDVNCQDVHDEMRAVITPKTGEDDSKS